jgi:hypothetical protein
MVGYADLMKMYLERTQDHLLMLIAGGTIPARMLVKFSGTAIVVGTLQSKDIIGVSEATVEKLTGEGLPVKTSGTVLLVSGEKIDAGKPLKCINLGKAGQHVNADLAASALGALTTKTGGNYGNQPANDKVDVASDAAGDVGQIVTVYGKLQAGTLDSETYTLNGAATIPGAKAWANVHAVVVSAAHAGTITVTENSGGLTITTLAPGTNSSGRQTAVDGRAYNIVPKIVASGASTKKVGIRGISTADVALSEEIQLTGATAVVLANAYKSITTMDIGDVESAQTVSLTVGVEEDENTCVGKSLIAVAATDTEFKANLKV